MRKKIDYLAVTSRNLRRIREAHGFNQKMLAEKIGSTPGRVSAYETGTDAMGTDYIERVCKALGDVALWEFFVDDDTPIVRDRKEQEALRRFREAVALGVAEDVARYEAFSIEQARKAAKDTPAEQHARIREKEKLVAEQQKQRRKKPA